jgi:integrase
MPDKVSPRVPSFRLHKQSGRGFVELNGRRIYLGRFADPATTQRYHQVIAEWVANGRLPVVNQNEITIVEVIARFWDHAQTYYRTPDNHPSKSLANFKSTLREMNALYGTMSAAEFGPRALKTLRARFIEQGHCRKHVNQLTSRVKHVIRWAVSEELIPASVIHGLETVAGLKRGRSESPESEPVRPVASAHIDGIEPHVSSQVWAMIQLQIFSGARPGEVVIMRPVDLDTTGRVWLYRPKTHKTAYRERLRTVYLGPKAQAIIRPFLQGRAVVEFLFSPAEAERDRRIEIYASRKTPLSCGNVPGSNRTKNPEVKPGAHYTNNTYRRAVERACVAAGIQPWTPGQLRHNAATNVRREFGLEAAQLLLGHAKADVTQLYAEINELKAIEVAQKIG